MIEIVVTITGRREHSGQAARWEGEASDQLMEILHMRIVGLVTSLAIVG